MTLEVRRLVLGELDTNCFVVSAEPDGAVLVIDPAADAAAVLAAVGERPVAAVVLTHGHFDHLGGVRDLLAATAAPLAVHRLDAASITDAAGTGGRMFGFEYTSPAADRVLEAGDTVRAGGLELSVLHTPGHTPGSICLLWTPPAGDSSAPHLFAGDTVFAGSVGRTDFPGGDPRDLHRSIYEVLAPLDDATVVHPGHGPDTTIGRERRVNPFFPRA